MWPRDLDGVGSCPFPCIKRCSPCTEATSSIRSFARASVPSQGRSALWRRAALCLQELKRLQIDEALPPVEDVRLPQALEELLGPFEVAHPDFHGAEALCDVAVRA